MQPTNGKTVRRGHAPGWQLSLCLLLAAIPSPAERFALEDLAKIVRVSNPRIAPDGKSIVIVVSRANMDTNRYDSELVQLQISSRSQRILTRGRTTILDPQWSPSGDRLAFVALADGKLQLFILPMDGGESFPLTKLSTPVRSYSWKPDGSALAVIHNTAPPKREGEDRHNRSFEVQNNDYLLTAAPATLQLSLVPSDGGAPQRLTSGDWDLAPYYPSWSPDGLSVALVRRASPYSGDADQTSIHILNVATGETRPLTGRTRGEGAPRFSPGGNLVASGYPRPGSPVTFIETWVSSLDGTPHRNLTRGIDRDVAPPIWMPDGKSLLVSANDGTTSGLWIQPLDGPHSRIDTGSVVPPQQAAWDLSVGPQGRIAFIGSEPTQPMELYYLPSPSAKPERLTNFNSHIVALQLSRREAIEWNGPEGFKLDGVITYPPGYSPNRKYPLVLMIHGGPAAATTRGFSPRPQYLASQGWIVFEPNYRGSNNRGFEFQTAIASDASSGPGRDIMSGVDYLIQKGIVDESKMAVSGWSYGGLLTAWLLGNYPNRWKAGVAGAAVTDILDQYNLNDSNVRPRALFDGSPWTSLERKAEIIRQSPITHAHQIKAPTLILSNTGDARVTITNSYKLYHALRDNGIKTRFIAYPLAGHSAIDPVHSRDVMRRWAAWIGEHFAGPVLSGGQ